MYGILYATYSTYLGEFSVLSVGRVRIRPHGIEPEQKSRKQTCAGQVHTSVCVRTAAETTQYVQTRTHRQGKTRVLDRTGRDKSYKHTNHVTYIHTIYIYRFFTPFGTRTQEETRQEPQHSPGTTMSPRPSRLVVSLVGGSAVGSAHALTNKILMGPWTDFATDSITGPLVTTNKIGKYSKKWVFEQTKQRERLENTYIYIYKYTNKPKTTKQSEMTRQQRGEKQATNNSALLYTYEQSILAVLYVESKTYLEMTTHDGLVYHI